MWLLRTLADLGHRRRYPLDVLHHPRLICAIARLQARRLHADSSPQPSGLAVEQVLIAPRRPELEELKPSLYRLRCAGRHHGQRENECLHVLGVPPHHNARYLFFLLVATA